MSRLLLNFKPVLCVVTSLSSFALSLAFANPALAANPETDYSWNPDASSPVWIQTPGNSSSNTSNTMDTSSDSSLDALMNFYQNPLFPQSSDSQQSDSTPSIDPQSMENYGLDDVDLEFHSLGDMLNAFNNSCDRVAQQVGETVFNLVTPRLLAGPKDIVRACPQWTKLSEHDRRDFYIGLVTAMAMAESSCNNNARARGTTGTAYGLWQGTRPRSPTEGARWVMRQIDSQVAQSGLLFWGNSLRNYWAVLNPRIHAYKVQAMLRKIPRCVVGALVSSQKHASANKSKAPTRPQAQPKLVTQASKDARINKKSIATVQVAKAEVQAKTKSQNELSPSKKAPTPNHSHTHPHTHYKKYRVYHKHPYPHWHVRYKRIRHEGHND